MHVIGTAGHVDHGKSALVSALTGVDPDRWIEEQLRGMTLDLGFAPLRIGDELRAGIVDVPGHERFLHNMLAGAAGMELLLLAVAANEGVREQTLEHLEILRFLNVARTIVAVTKIDLVPPAQRGEAIAAIERDLRETIARSAPLVGVSSQTGEGLSELRRRIGETLDALPPRDAQAPVYLPIDRAFTIAGAGTIVTGTLMQGTIASGDRVAIAPSGSVARVRSIEVFGSKERRVEAGARVALNLPGVDRREIARGHAVVDPAFAARDRFAVRFTPLAGVIGLLGRRTHVRAYIGSAEIAGTLIFDEAPPEARETGATLALRTPAVAFPGTRFVVRRLSPKTLLGGGYVEVAAALEEAPAAPSLTPAEAAAKAALRRRGREPSTPEEIALEANLRVEVARAALDSLAERDEALALRKPAAFVDSDAAKDLFHAALERIEELHRSEPWAMGATSIALSRALGIPEPLLVRVLAEYVERAALANRSGYYAALAHVPALAAAQRELFDQLLPSQPNFVPLPFADVAAAVKRSKVEGAARAFETLLARGALVKVGEDLYRGPQIAQILARVEEFLRRNERMTAAEFRDLLGTSRKYAVPMLEWLDARGVTIRSGDHRTLRKSAV